MCPHPKDDKFIACAVAALADFAVMGNKQGFPQDQLEGARVVSAGELLHLVHPRIRAPNVNHRESTFFKHVFVLRVSDGQRSLGSRANHELKT